MPRGAWFPALTFLQLLFGRRSFAELREAFPECRTRGDDVRVLIDAIFPKQASRPWAVD
jgi:hypothetical protein